MKEKIMIVGEPSKGKSACLRNLDHEKTLYITATSKRPVPVKGLGDKFTRIDRKDLSKGNWMSLQDVMIKSPAGVWVSVLPKLFSVAKQREMHTIVLDDFQYILTRLEELLKSSGEFKDDRQIYKILKNFIIQTMGLLDEASSNDIQPIIIWQRVIGQDKLLIPGDYFHEQTQPQGYFDIILEADTDGIEYVLKTNGRGMERSPMGMFDKDVLESDITKLLEQMYNY